MSGYVLGAYSSEAEAPSSHRVALQAADSPVARMLRALPDLDVLYIYACPLVIIAQLLVAIPYRSWAQLYEERPDEERATYEKGERLQVRHCTTAVHALYRYSHRTSTVSLLWVVTRILHICHAKRRTSERAYMAIERNLLYRTLRLPPCTLVRAHVCCQFQCYPRPPAVPPY